LLDIDRVWRFIGKSIVMRTYRRIMASSTPVRSSVPPDDSITSTTAHCGSDINSNGRYPFRAAPTSCRYLANSLPSNFALQCLIQISPPAYRPAWLQLGVGFHRARQTSVFVSSESRLASYHCQCQMASRSGGKVIYFPIASTYKPQHIGLPFGRLSCVLVNHFLSITCRFSSTVAYWSCVLCLITSDFLRPFECFRCECRRMRNSSPFQRSRSIIRWPTIFCHLNSPHRPRFISGLLSA
jgi:hypothetical protein